MDGLVDEWLPIALACVAVLLGALLIMRGGRSKAGCQTEGSKRQSHTSRLLAQTAHFDTVTGGCSSEVTNAVASPSAAPAVEGVDNMNLCQASDDGVEVTARWQMEYQLVLDSIPDFNATSNETSQEDASAGIWEVTSTEGARALLDTSPSSSVICCGFFVPFADGVNTLHASLARLEAAQLAGFVVARVDIKASPEAAAWAEVSHPSICFLRTNGSMIDHVPMAELRNSTLLKKALSLAGAVVKDAAPKLDALAKRFPGALCDEVLVLPPNADVAKMRERGIECLNTSGAKDEAHTAFVSLCDCCSDSTRAARVRDVACVARTIRSLSPCNLLPFLDLARRLAARKAFGGSDPGASAALELLLDAVLQQGLHKQGGDHCKLLALQFLSNCFGRDDLREGLLHVAGRLVLSNAWALCGLGSNVADVRVQEAATALLFNCSVALRTARSRAEHPDLLDACISILRHAPEDQKLTIAVGNMLAVGGGREEAKMVLQTQPLPPLRLLAAAIFRGDLDGPDGCAFPSAWKPETSTNLPGNTNPAGNVGGERRGRGAIPARHRRMRGG